MKARSAKNSFSHYLIQKSYVVRSEKIRRLDESLIYNAISAGKLEWIELLCPANGRLIRISNARDPNANRV